MGTIHQPGHQLMGDDGEINISLGMTRKTKLAVQPLHRRSNPIPAKLIGMAIASGHWTPPLQFAKAQDLQGGGEILFTVETIAIGGKKNMLGNI